MDEPDFLRSKRIAIIGLGLMGGSLALALRGKCAALLGVDPDPQTVDTAIERGVVDHAACRPQEILPEADLIVLAAPVRAILFELQRLAELHPGRAMVLDLGSTKRQIVAAMEALPARFDPLGGHPMCGKEKGSLANAEAGLFQGAVFALTPLERTSPAVLHSAQALVAAVGAQPLLVDAVTHDRWVAATSHLPYLAANALACATPLEARPLIGGGLRSTTRLAPSSLGMTLDFLTTNRDNVLEALGRFRQALDALEAGLRDEQSERLAEDLAAGALNYRRLIG